MTSVKATEKRKYLKKIGSLVPRRDTTCPNLLHTLFCLWNCNQSTELKFWPGSFKI
jgi:hypothetical protein